MTRRLGSGRNQQLRRLPSLLGQSRGGSFRGASLPEVPLIARGAMDDTSGLQQARPSPAWGTAFTLDPLGLVLPSLGSSMTMPTRRNCLALSQPRLAVRLHRAPFNRGTLRLAHLPVGARWAHRHPSCALAGVARQASRLSNCVAEPGVRTLWSGAQGGQELRKIFENGRQIRLLATGPGVLGLVLGSPGPDNIETPLTGRGPTSPLQVAWSGIDGEEKGESRRGGRPTSASVLQNNTWQLYPTSPPLMLSRFRCCQASEQAG